jgi:RimJ/RimL family protein N-acetyltransferase
MKISDQLFIGEHICLGPIDHEKDAQIESRWTHNMDYLRNLGLDPAVPRSAFQIKKQYEAIEKSQEEKGNLFYFTIRLREDDRLIGFGKIYWIEWTNQTGFIQLGIGDSTDRRCGYGTEALQLLSRFAFDELNLYRLTAWIPEYNQAGLTLFQKFGFAVEVRRRQAVYRDDRRCDMLHLGLLAEEWVGSQSLSDKGDR